MKKLLKFMLAAVVIATVSVSCKDTPDTTTGGDTTGPEVYPTKVDGGPDGATLQYSDVSTGDFVLTAEMGINCEAYRLDVMPLARYMNDLMEFRKENKDATEDEFIIAKLYNSGGNSGYALSERFDALWGESKYRQAEMIHGIEYIVIAGGCEMADGTGPMTMTKLIVPLEDEALIGDPRVEIKLTEHYRGFIYEYTMNDDCYAFYEFNLPTEHFDEFVDAYGTEHPEWVRDIICCWYIAPSSESYESQIDFGYGAQPGITCTLLGVGMDMNGTLSPEFTRVDGETIPPPDSGNTEYSFTKDYVSASAIMTTWNVNYDVTGAVFSRPCDPSTLKQLESMPEMDLKLLLANEGYGRNHLNDDQELYWGLIPNTDYDLLTIGRNKAYQLKDSIRHYKFKTLPLITDQPEKSKAIITVGPDGANGISKDIYKALYTFTEDVTVYYERVMEKGFRYEGIGPDLTDPQNRDLVIPFLLGPGGNSSAAFYSGDRCNWAGLSPETHYCHFVIAEDRDGYLGELFLYEFDTRTNKGGPNPEVKITSKVEALGDGSNEWAVTFTCNADVNKLRYCLVPDETDESMTIEARKNIWQDMLMSEYGMENVDTSRIRAKVTKYTREVAVAIAFGVKADGSPVQTPLAYLIFEPSMIQSSVMANAPLRISASNHANGYREVGL